VLESTKLQLRLKARNCKSPRQHTLYRDEGKSKSPKDVVNLCTKVDVESRDINVSATEATSTSARRKKPWAEFRESPPSIRLL
jgi:hypothetical protein